MEESTIFSILESIGLSKNEIKVYLDLTQSGKSGVIDISKRTGIHRSNTYDLLEKLLEKGIVDQSIENDKKFFYPIDPQDLYDYLKQKEKELAKIIPEIEKIQNIPHEKRRVTISEGLNSAKNIISHLLDFKEPIYAIGASREFLELIEGFFEEFHNKRIKNKILLKSILEIDSMKYIKRLNQMDYTEARYLPSNCSKTITYICKDKLIILIWEGSISVIIIENKSTSKSYKNYFNILWEEALIIE